MTLAEMRQLAECVDAMDEDQGGNRLARGILALLGAGMPCGWEAPEAGRDTRGPVVLWEGSQLWPDEARGLAVALLRAADEAEGMR